MNKAEWKKLWRNIRVNKMEEKKIALDIQVCGSGYGKVVMVGGLPELHHIPFVDVFPGETKVVKKALKEIRKIYFEEIDSGDMFEPAPDPMPGNGFEDPPMWKWLWATFPPKRPKNIFPNRHFRGWKKFSGRYRREPRFNRMREEEAVN